MGINLRPIITKHEISLKDLHGKRIAIDAFNFLYQFLTSIRAQDGSPLTTEQGVVTSHLIGLFSRTTAFLQAGIKPIFVFDGVPPQIKEETRKQRKAAKAAAQVQYEQAKEDGNLAAMRSLASRTVSLNAEMINDAKELLTALGVPIVQAPSEGEAQAVYLVQQGDAYACASQDYDTLLFQCPRLVRNLSIAGRRKKAGKFGYQTIMPEMVLLDEVCQENNVTSHQLVLMGILIGTDYNPKGIKGIGPKKALKLVQTHEQPDELFAAVAWQEHYPNLAWKKIYDTITKMPLNKDYTISFKPLQTQKVLDLLVKKYGFNEERTKERLDKLKKATAQTGLSSFF